MDPVKRAFARSREFVSDHKVAITATVAVTATAVVCIRIQRSAIEDWKNFLTEKGLIDEFYNTEI
jgi:hypothetical protein